MTLHAFLLSSLLTILGHGAYAALPIEINNEPLPSLAPMLEKVLPAVVNVSVTSISAQPSSLFQDPFFRQFFDLPELGPKTEQSAGSGVIVDAKNGYIATNYHVIKGAHQIKITLFNGQELQAELLGADQDTDIALLQVAPRQLQEFPLGNSDALRIGDFIVAVGNPFGLGHSVTSGIVSALGRTGLGIERYEDFIQTDASINPGNSGGALVNLRGELIGINTAILAPGGGNIGIGFSIPINRVQRIIEQLLQYGDVQRGIIGVISQDLPAAYTTTDQAPAKKGALLVEIVPQSSAEKAGIKVGDIIVQVGNEEIDSSSDLRNTLGLVRAGESRKIKFWRGNQLEEAQVQIDDPQSLRPVSEQIYEKFTGAKMLNITLSTQQGARGAILISSIKPNSPAAQAGLQSQDIIIAANDKNIETLKQLRQRIEQSKGHFILQFKRDDLNLEATLF